MTQTMELVFHHVPAECQRDACSGWIDEHGNVLPRYAAMGKPLDPTPAQAEQLNRETALPAQRQRAHLTEW